MKKRYIGLFLFILIIVFSTGMVTAADDDTISSNAAVYEDTTHYDNTDDIGMDNTYSNDKLNADYEKIIEKNISTEKKEEALKDVYVSSSGRGDGSRTSPSSFRTALSLVSDNGTIHLTSDDGNVYPFSYTEITPSTLVNNVSNLNIIGDENANISLNSRGGELFYVYGVNLHFNNINFANGGNQIYYGSITVVKSNVTFENCSISNYQGKIKDCNFIRPYSSNLSLINCDVHDNNLTNTTSLIGNTISRIMGYAIGKNYIQYETEHSNISITNSIFKNNRMDASSNILFIDSLYNINVINNTFRENSGENGLIQSFMGRNELYANNTFINNNGTCLYLTNSKSDIRSNEFINNHAKKASCLMLSETKSNITDNLFKNNSAETYGGSIINIASSQNNITNCVFENNSAGIGGAIYNIYNNISVNNCSFISNRADEGGALYFSRKTDAYNMSNNNNTVTNSLFDNNVADTGSALYLKNAQMNLSNNALIDNSTKRNLVYACENASYTLDGNWWSTNNPDFNVLTKGIVPDNWRVMTFANTTPKVNNTVNLKVGLNTLNTGENSNVAMPYRLLYLNSTGGSFNKNNIKINGQTTLTYTGSDNKPVATIDNQQIKLNDRKEAFINVNDIKTCNETVNIEITTSIDLTKDITVKVNDEVIETCKSNGSVNIEYAIENTNSGNYSITVNYPGDDRYAPTSATATLEVYNIKNTHYNNVVTPLTEYNFTITTDLPSKYDPRTSGLTTPIKDQGKSGSCWVFASIGTLEQNIKKLTNVTYDLSENNPKNIISKFSEIGFKDQLPNNGGNAEQMISYLVGWYGPVSEYDDPYVDYSTFSPYYSPVYHVQDVITIPARQNLSDFNRLKEAIYNYGSVQVAYYAGSTAENIYLYENYDDNHAASFVGWDDNYDKNNFAVTVNNTTITPPANGAFIIKNSWGGGFADDGYQYISYYDVTYGGFNDSSYNGLPMYTFMLNNTPVYDNIYQYGGINEGKREFNGSASINSTYNATQDETLAAVGTYFDDESEYLLNIYINGKKVHTQQSTINLPGYRTVKLNRYFQLNKGDEFTIELNIRSLTHENTTVHTIKTDNSPERGYAAYVSYDGGETWTLIGGTPLEENYVLKAYTLKTPQIETTTNITNNTLKITTKISENDKDATVTYKINNQTLKDGNNKVIKYEITGNATKETTINIGNINGKINITTVYTSDEYVIESEKITGIKTDLMIDPISEVKMGDIINFQGTLKDEDDELLSSENITITLKNTKDASDVRIYNVVTDKYGNFSINHTADAYGEFNVTFLYGGSETYLSSANSTSYNIKRETNLFMYSRSGDTKGSTIKVSGKLQSNGDEVKGETVTIRVNGKTYTATTGGYGYFTINHTITTYDDLNVTFTYAGSNSYLPSTNSTAYKVKKPTNIYMYTRSGDTKDSTIKVSGKLQYNNGEGIKGEKITIKVNDKTYTATTGGYGYFTINHTITTYDNLNITFTYAGSTKYLSSKNTTVYTVKKPTTLFIYSRTGDAKGSTIKVSGKLLYGDEGVKGETVTIKVNGKTYTATTGGYGYFTINHTITSYDDLNISMSYAGSSGYYSCSNSTVYKVKKPTNIYMYSRSNDKVGSTIKVSGKLQYNNGEGIKGETVKINVNGKTYTATSGGYGYFTVNYTITSNENLNVKFTYDGSKLYEKSTNSTVYTVKT